MWTFEFQHKGTGERTVIWGYNLQNAFRRNPEMNPDDWILIRQDCEDDEAEIVCAFEIQHKKTKETAVIHGITLEEAFGPERDPEEWEILGWTEWTEQN